MSKTPLKEVISCSTVDLVTAFCTSNGKDSHDSYVTPMGIINSDNKCAFEQEKEREKGGKGTRDYSDGS